MKMKKEKLAGTVEKPRRKRVDWKALEIVHPHAAGIDIGGREHWVAISPERDEDPVGGSTVSQEIWNRWRNGWSKKAFAAWRCNRTGAIGSRGMKWLGKWGR